MYVTLQAETLPHTWQQATWQWEVPLEAPFKSPQLRRKVLCVKSLNYGRWKNWSKIAFFKKKKNRKFISSGTWTVRWIHFYAAWFSPQTMGSGLRFSPFISRLHFLGSVIRLVGAKVTASISQYCIILYVLQAGKRQGRASFSQKPWQNIFLYLIGLSHHDGQSNIMYWMA